VVAGYPTPPEIINIIFSGVLTHVFKILKLGAKAKAQSVVFTFTKWRTYEKY